MTPLSNNSTLTFLVSGRAAPSWEITPLLTVQTLPALSSMLVSDGIMLSSGEALTLGILDPQVGMPAAAGWVVATQAPPVQLHQLQLMFSW